MNENAKIAPGEYIRENLHWIKYTGPFGLAFAGMHFVIFRDLVKENGPWDFKNSVAFSSESCPSTGCERTVSLCGVCVDYDVPGNIHYGYVGRRGFAIRRWLLLNRASANQKGGIDPDEDVVAITIGMDLYDGFQRSLCQVLREHLDDLNYGQNDRAKNCRPCAEEFRR